MSADGNPPADGPPPGDAPRPRWWERSAVQSLACAAMMGTAVVGQHMSSPPTPEPQSPPAANPIPKITELRMPTHLRSSQREAKARLDRGADLARGKEYDRAVAEFTAAIRILPDSAEAHYHRGLAHGNAGRLDEAIADLDAAVRLAPGDPRPRHHRGRFHARLERFDDAVADYTGALGLVTGDPDFRTRILQDRARAHFFNRAYATAAADCTQVLRSVPGAAEAYLLRGQATEAGGDPAAAAADYREARRLDPELYRAARAEWPTLPESP